MKKKKETALPAGFGLLNATQVIVTDRDALECLIAAIIEMTVQRAPPFTPEVAAAMLVESALVTGMFHVAEMVVQHDASRN